MRNNRFENFNRQRDIAVFHGRSPYEGVHPAPKKIAGNRRGVDPPSQSPLGVHQPWTFTIFGVCCRLAELRNPLTDDF